ncbi:hypothetical protein BH09CHL1_BH09CHL1_13180 [soil metagenome]
MRRALLALLLITVLVPTFGVSARAQSSEKTIYLRTVDILTGKSITSACYIIDGASEEGCDENGDGLIRYRGIASGTFSVHQTRRAVGYLPVGDFPITISDSPDDEYYTVDLARLDGVTQEIADIAVSPVDADTFQVLTGACFQFYGGSEIGCDDNGDGQVDFSGIAVGTYLLTQTQAIDGYESTADVWALVSGDRMIQVYLQPDTPQGPAGDVPVDVSLVTRDPETGDLLKGACYIINNASIEGCDENGDGQVDYRGVVPGTYTVTQTSAPSGFAAIDDFTITISNEAKQVFLVRQGPENSRLADVSIVAVDANTGQRIESSGLCFVIVGGSEEGCDTNNDGQVDFLGVIPGSHPVQITGIPEGYRAFDGPLSIDIDEDASGAQVFYVAFLMIR